MFRKLLTYATSGITTLIAKYAMRATVAVPFVFALGFGLAGLTVILIDAFGYRDAYFLLGAGFAALGAIGGVAVWIRERRERAEERTVERPGAVGAAIETAKHLPSAVASGASDASSSFRLITDATSRNWPLVIAALFAVLLLGGTRSQDRYGRRY